MGISDDMHKDFLKVMREPNFTEGEWSYNKLGRAWALTDGNGASLLTIHNEYDGDDENGDVIVTPFATVYSESDARLMAQSKKMYEVIIEALQDYDANDGIGDLLEFTWPKKMRAILSEIDKE